MIVYNAYYDLRTQYISTYYHRRPYMYTFIERITTNNIITLNKHELFLIKSFERRNAVVNNQTYLRCIISFFLSISVCTCSVFSVSFDMYVYVVVFSVNHRIVYLYVWFVSMCLCCIRPNTSYVVVSCQL